MSSYWWSDGGRQKVYLSMRINGHGHILPEPSQIPKFMKDKKLFWIDEDKKFMRQGDWSRPISDPSFFIKEKIEWMHQYQIDHSVMLCLSQLYCNGWDEQDCFDAIRFQNDFNASVQGRSWGSFRFRNGIRGHRVRCHWRQQCCINFATPAGSRC